MPPLKTTNELLAFHFFPGILQRASQIKDRVTAYHQDVAGQLDEGTQVGHIHRNDTACAGRRC